MIKAVVYKTETGFSMKYAMLLGKKIDKPVYSYEESANNLNKNDEIIFISALYSRKLNKYKRIKKKYNLKAVIAVGMTPPSSKIEKEIIEDNNINGIPVFYLQGGIKKEKLHGMKKFMINMIEKGLKLTDKEDPLYEIIKDNKTYVSSENLKSFISWYKTQK